MGDGHRRRLDALADLRLGRRRLDVDDDVASRKHALHGVLHPVGRGVALPHGGAGRDADHDVGEGSAPGLAEAEPTNGDGRVEAGDRVVRRLHGVRRRAIHQHVDVAADEPGGGGDDEHRDEERCDRVALGEPRPCRDEAAHHGDRREQVGAEVDRVREERRARVLPGSAIRDDEAREVDRDDQEEHGEDPPRGLDVQLDPAREACHGERCDADRDEHEEARLGERGEVLGLAVPVEVTLVGGLRRDADGEEREERGHQVCPGVRRVRDEAEAPRREACDELDRDQDGRSDDRRERCATQRRHARRLCARARAPPAVLQVASSSVAGERAPSRALARDRDRLSMCSATRAPSRPAPRTSIELNECRNGMPAK